MIMGLIILTDLFAALPTTLQCHLLLRIADGSKDVLEQCRLMLLVLQRYPERIPEEGVSCQFKRYTCNGQSLYQRFYQ